MQYFDTKFLDEANGFLASLDPKVVRKLLYNIDRAAHKNDPRLFKKLRDEIWEFRSSDGSKQIRLLAFWDKTDTQKTFVIATHGFIKKQIKCPPMKLSGRKISGKNILNQKIKGMPKKPLKSYSLEEMKDKYIGKAGTRAREEYEHELRMDVLGCKIKKARLERKLTQDQLGKLVGVKKSQISKLENSANSASISTISKVFTALDADVYFTVKFRNKPSRISGKAAGK